MLIAIDARELRTSTGRYVERLLYYLQKIDAEHDYVVLLTPKDIRGWKPTNVRFRTVVCPHKEFTFDEQIGFLRQLRGLHADLVHFPMVQQPVLYGGRVVTTMQDLTTLRFRNVTKNIVVFTFKQYVYAWVNKRVARKSAAIITPTEFVKEDVVRFTGVSPDKITYTHLAADEFDDPAEPVTPLVGKQFIMYNGRPQAHKNLTRLIEAFTQLHELHPDLYLVIAGKKDASFDRYEELVSHAGLSDRVIFTDWIADGQLKWAMQHCKAYVWPSLSEGFGLPPLEAMLYGAPVVSSNATCMPEVLGDAARYFDPRNVADMTVAIDDVLTNGKLREQLIARGKKQVTRFSWERMAKQTLAVYNKVLGT